VHALARAAETVAQAPGVTAYGSDLTTPDAVPDVFLEGADVVYHCAAEIAREPLMRAVNVEATRALLAKARGRVGHWVQLSSLSVYGTPRGGVIDEESPLRPRSLYARTKLEADGLVADSARNHFSCTLVRPAAVIGPNMRATFMHALIQAIARSRFCFIGAPDAIGNYVHEENVVSALLLCGTRSEARGRTYNVSQNASIEDMVGVIARELGRARQPPRIPESAARLAAVIGRVLPGFPLTSSRVDALTSRVEYRTDRIERELGFRHTRSIEDALRDVTAQWKKHA
jgi:nucleoside-diphosphate-sugar epimerase